MAVRRLAPPSFSPRASPSRRRISHGPKAQIAKYPEGRQASAVIPLLWRAQEQHGGWLPQRRSILSPTCSAWPISACWRSRPSTPCSILAPVGRKAHVQVCGTTPCMLRGADDLIEVCQRPDPSRAAACHRRRRLLLGRGRVPGRLRERADGADLERHLRGPDGGKLREGARRFRQASRSPARKRRQFSAPEGGPTTLRSGLYRTDRIRARP